MQTPVKSSFIRSIGYDPQGHVAQVEFKSGSVYHYRNVPKVTVTRWMDCKSKGQYFHRNIRNRFGYKRIA
ncbi:MAG: KTSC domain-containing protein [Anaerolineae bacterium]